MILLVRCLLGSESRLDMITQPAPRSQSAVEQDLVGHVIGRDQAKQLGWSDDKINSRANTQPEHVRCSVSSGGKHVREQAAAAPGYGGHSSVGLPLVLDMPLCTSRE
jgi:hypothetical protein